MKKYKAPELTPILFESTDIISASVNITTHDFWFGNDATTKAGSVNADEIDVWNDLINA